MSIHFIGMGERIIGDLAAVLFDQGHTISGSDVAFATSTLQRLKNKGLMPECLGWFPEKLRQDLDKVIVGSQVSTDNPELQAAWRLGLPIYSYAAYIYEYAQDKQRIVITGEEEKRLICTLVLHVLSYLHKAFDYVVDTPVPTTSVQLSDAPIILLEGDANPSSLIDLRPQSLHYQHNMVLIGGISWQASVNYPTLDTYLQYMTNLADASPKGGTIIYCEEDSLAKNIGNESRSDVKNETYKAHPHRNERGKTHLITPQGDILFPHADIVSMRAVAGAQQLLRNLAVTDHQFYEALATL